MTEQQHAEPQNTPRQPYSAPTLQPLLGEATASKQTIFISELSSNTGGS